MTDGPGFEQADRYDVVQRFRLSTNVYEVRSSGRVVAWARQKIVAMRERIEIWDSPEQRELVCAVQARKVLELRGSYDVVDAAGERIGVLRKAFRRSFLRSTWTVMDAAEQPIATVTESSLPVAIVRRIKGLIDVIPVVGWVLALVPIPIHFTWQDPTDGRELGRYSRVWGIRDRYELHLGGDAERRIDRRTAIAMAICLDALQGR